MTASMSAAAHDFAWSVLDETKADFLDFLSSSPPGFVPVVPVGISNLNVKKKALFCWWVDWLQCLQTYVRRWWIDRSWWWASNLKLPAKGWYKGPRRGCIVLGNGLLGLESWWLFGLIPWWIWERGLPFAKMDIQEYINLFNYIWFHTY